MIAATILAIVLCALLLMATADAARGVGPGLIGTIFTLGLLLLAWPHIVEGLL
jgi:hypothetical protein